MKKNQMELLKYLASQNKSTPSTEIANALSLSVRSIKNLVRDINNLYGIKIILSSRSGYSLNPKNNISLLLSDNENTVPQTNEERSFYIIKEMILNHSTEIDIFDLCDYLCVSYSTVRSLISKMNKTFSSYHVEFSCENERIQIKGEEKDKRKLISFVINEEYKNSFINTELLEKKFSNINVKKLQRIIINTFKDHNFYLNDFSSANLLLHILIIIDREMNGNQLTSGRTEFTFDSKYEATFFSDLLNKIEANFNLRLNEFETFEIYMLFKANANYSTLFFKDDLKEIVGMEILSLTTHYVKEINKLYMLDLSSDSFITPFSLHLKNLLFRAKEGRHTSNPMSESIRTNSPIVFDVAIFISLDLMQRYDVTINRDETAFLAMHIGAEVERQNESADKCPVLLVCPNYHDMDQKVMNTLLINFGNQINLLGCVQNEQQIESVKEPIGLIFSMIPLTYQTKNSEIIIELSPLELSTQFDTIQNALTKSHEAYKDQKLRLNFHDFFEEDLFVFNHQLDTKEKILTYLCNKLLEKKYVDSSFKTKIYERENAASTAFGNVAIPHSVDMDAVKTSIGVGISKKGIRWGKNTVHVVLLLAINKADRRKFRYLYESLISFFNEKNIIQEIRSCTSFEQFEKSVYTWIDQKE